IGVRVGERLKMSRNDVDAIRALVSERLKFREVFQMRESTLQRFVREPYFDELLEFHRADAIASDGNLAFYEFCNSRRQSLKVSKSLEAFKLIDGQDLIQLGLQPGPEFSQILRVVEDLALERQIQTKEQALEY